MSEPTFDPVAFERQVADDLASWRADLVTAAWDATYSDVPASEAELDHLAEEVEIGKVVAARRGYLDGLVAARAMQRYDKAAARDRHGYVRDRAALAEWARTPEAQETAARAKTIGLFDPVPDEGPRVGPVCPPERPADPDLAAGDPVHRNPAAGHTAPRPGRWRRWCRWISG